MIFQLHNLLFLNKNMLAYLKNRNSKMWIKEQTKNLKKRKMCSNFLSPCKYFSHPSKLYIDAFCRSIETLYRIGINSTEYVLLKAIIFCYPAVQNRSEEAQQLLRKQQLNSVMLQTCRRPFAYLGRGPG
jgi:hypothetical protein